MFNKTENESDNYLTISNMEITIFIFAVVAFFNEKISILPEEYYDGTLVMEFALLMFWTMHEYTELF